VTEKRIWDVGRQQFSAEIMIHLDHLYRVAVHLVKNEDEAEDCVQETCARALGSYHQFEPGSNMKAWLNRILYNFFYDSYARNKRLVSADDLVGPGAQKKDFWDSLPSNRPGPESQVLNQELATKIKDALARIPEEFRAPIVLVDMGDLSYAEVAAILSCPIGTVRSRLSRGRKLLQGILSGYLAEANRG
jgi:RNA polymerase sigma-70 factor (ECF subfamily)